MRRGMMPPSAQHGRHGDTLLVHMKPSELAAAHAAARRRGLRGVTTNPTDGHPEMWAAETDSDAAANNDTAQGGNRDVSTGQTEGDFSNQSGAVATDETDLLSAAANKVGSLMSKLGAYVNTPKGAVSILGAGMPGLGIGLNIATQLDSMAEQNARDAVARGELTQAQFDNLMSTGTPQIDTKGNTHGVGPGGTNNPNGPNGGERGSGMGDQLPPGTPGATSAAARAANYTGTRGLYLPSADEQGEYKYDPTSQRVRWITKER